MFCDSENLPSPVDTAQPQFKSSSELGKVESQKTESFWSHMQFQRRKLFRTLMSKK
jgi:hypothetical protein